MIVSAENDSIECLNFNDLYAIFGRESDDLRSWADVAAFAADLGSTTSSWPSGDIAITAPGDESGTWGSFIEIALEDIQEERAEAGNAAAEGEPGTRTPGDVYVASANDNLIIDGVGANPSGIGFVGYAFAVNNSDRVRMIPIDGGDGTCLAPDEETVAANTYPIARDLYIYAEQGRIDPASEAYSPGACPVRRLLPEPRRPGVGHLGRLRAYLQRGTRGDTGRLGCRQGRGRRLVIRRSSPPSQLP